MGNSSASTLSVVQEFVEETRRSADIPALRELLDHAVAAIGLDYYALVHHIDFGRPAGSSVHLTNYPQSLVTVFREWRGRADAVLRAAERAGAGFSWSEVPRLVQVDERDLEHLRRARRAGIGDGYTLPFHIPGEDFGSCSFAVSPDRAMPADICAAAQTIGTFGFAAARRILLEANGLGQGAPIPLTRRQRECLIMVARGKSDSVAAQLLGLRPRTVNEHIEAAKRRFAVASRQQLLVRALQSSQITFVETLD